MQIFPSTFGLLALAALTCALAFLSLAPVGSVSADAYKPTPNQPWASWGEEKAKRLAVGGRNAEIEDPASVEAFEEQDEEASFEDEDQTEFNPSEDVPELENQFEADHETEFDLPQDVAHLEDQSHLDTVQDHVEAAAVVPVEHVAEKLDAASSQSEHPTQVTPVEGHSQQ